MNVTMDDLYKQVNTVQCYCGAEYNPEDYGITITGYDDVDEMYEFVDCCDDPSLTPVITSKTPLFPPEDKDSEPNVEFYNYGTKQYEYDVDEDLMDMINGVEEEPVQTAKKPPRK